MNEKQVAIACCLHGCHMSMGMCRGAMKRRETERNTEKKNMKVCHEMVLFVFGHIGSKTVIRLALCTWGQKQKNRENKRFVMKLIHMEPICI